MVPVWSPLANLLAFRPTLDPVFGGYFHAILIARGEAAHHVLRARARSFPPPTCPLRFVKRETKTRVFSIHADQPFRVADAGSRGVSTSWRSRPKNSKAFTGRPATARPTAVSDRYFWPAYSKPESSTVTLTVSRPRFRINREPGTGRRGSRGLGTHVAGRRSRDRATCGSGDVVDAFRYLRFSAMRLNRSVCSAMRQA